MKKMLLIAVIFCAASCFAGTAFGSGTTSLCGFVSDPAAVARNCGYLAGRTSAPSSPTTMGVFPFTISAAGNYQLTADAGADATVCQITVNAISNGPVKIWLGDHTLTGRICAPSNVNQGLEIYGGVIRCNWAQSGSNTGCIRYEQNGGTFTAPSSIHDLDIQNANDPGAFGAVGAIQVVIQPTAYSGGGFIIAIYNVTCLTNATNVQAARSQCLNTIGKSAGGTTFSEEIYQNNFTVAATTAAAQGLTIFCFNGGSYAHNNYIELKTNSTGASARGGNFDGDGGTSCSGGNFARYNYIIANNNRAWRQRTSINDVFEENIIKAASDTATGAIYTGDQTNTNDEVDANFAILNNDIEIQIGPGIWGRGQTGKTGIIAGNIFRCGTGCSSGRVISTGLKTGNMTAITYNAQNNTVDPTIGSGGACGSGTATNSCANANSTINYCNSGTASGAGTKNATTCP